MGNPQHCLTKTGSRMHDKSLRALSVPGVFSMLLRAGGRAFGILLASCVLAGVAQATSITLTAVSKNGFGQFVFNGGGASNGFTSDTINTVTPGSPVAGATKTLTDNHSQTVITQSSAPLGFVLESVVCSGVAGGGQPAVDNVARTLTFTAAQVGGNSTNPTIACTVTNAKIKLDLALCLDASGSISGANWTLEKSGTASGLSAALNPGHLASEVRVTIVRFDTTADLMVGPTVIDSAATLTSVNTAINAMTQPGSSTNVAGCIEVARQTMGCGTTGGGGTNSCLLDDKITRIIDISTDGVPNVGSPDGQTAAVTSATNAETAGVDQLNVIGVGTGFNEANALDWVFPPVGAAYTPATFPSGKIDHGFVLTVASFTDYNPAITSKILAEVQFPTLGLTKSNGSSTVTAGGTTTYTLTVTNSGSGDTSGTITVVDVLPTGLTHAAGVFTPGGTNGANWSCTPSSQVITCVSSTVIAGSGGTSVFSFPVSVAASLTGTVTNPAQVGGGGDQNEPTPTSSTAATCTGTDSPIVGCAVDTDTVNVVNLSLAKSNGSSTVTAGGTTTYTLTVTNSGNVATTGTVTVVDVLPTGLTHTAGGFTPGGTNGANWSCTAVLQVITCTSSSPAIAGSGGTSLFSFPVSVAASLTGTVTNPAQVGGGGDPNESTPTSTTAATCTGTDTPIKGCAVDGADTVNVVNLSLAKSDGGTTVLAGATTTYTLTVTNSGNVATSGTITVVDVLPTGLTHVPGVFTPGGLNGANWSCTAALQVVTCTSSSPAIPGSGGTSVFSFPVDVAASLSGTVTNPAQVGGGGDPNESTPTSGTAATCTGTNTPIKGCAVDTNTVEVLTLAISKLASAGTVTPNSPLSFTITASNTGTAPADNSLVKDPAIPGFVASGVSCIGSTNPANLCAGITTTLLLLQGSGIVLPSFPVGATVTFEVTGTFTLPSGTIINVATVTTPEGLSIPASTISASASATSPATLIPTISRENLLALMVLLLAVAGGVFVRRRR